MPPDPTERPNAIPWPPIILVGAIAVALALEQVAPLPVSTQSGASGIVRMLGWVLMSAGVGLDLWSIATLMRHRTTVLPNSAAETLVTSGPFSFSRNPIYLGNTLLLAGAAPAFALVWFLPCALAAAVLFQTLAIRREEAHLAAKFGAAWDAYAARTPRWIWRL